MRIVHATGSHPHSLHYISFCGGSEYLGGTKRFAGRIENSDTKNIFFMCTVTDIRIYDPISTPSYGRLLTRLLCSVITLQTYIS